MKRLKNFVFVLFTVFFLSSIVAFAHTLQTANNCTVGHYDNLGYCLPWYPYDCPISDSTFESTWSFSAYDRVYSGTYSFNCHGRTFDNRGCWINYADPYINCDGPYCPATPAYGDAIIWFDGSGTTTHSATIISSWNGTSTTIKSKYGKQGEYWHSLADCVRVYGGNWTVTRFSAGTTIYSVPQDNAIINKKDIKKKFLMEREKMPWYNDVLESEDIFESQGREIIEKIVSLDNESRNCYEKATSTSEKIDILFKDFTNTNHYMFLGIFNSPKFSTDYIHGIEAGNLLVDISNIYPESKGIIVDQFMELINRGDLESYSDPIKGAAIFFLGKILEREKKVELIDAVNSMNITNFQDRITMVPTYVEYYLEQLAISIHEAKTGI